jgi:hypothetical protein
MDANKQSEGNGDGDDECAAHIAQKEKENDRDEDDSFGQIVQHGMRGEMDQIAAIEEGN